MCNVQEYCENENQRFETFLSKNFNEYVRLDITYDTLTADWDKCISEGEQPNDPFQMDAFLDIPLFGVGECLRGRIARFDKATAIENGSMGTGNLIFRVVGDFVVGGTSQMFFLTEVNSSR